MSATNAHKRLYITLCNVLDALCKEAPIAEEIYHPAPGNHQGRIQARSRALLHLFLKARFGLLSFSQRETYVTDGSNDGGIDAFYLDENAKTIYILQSKFRATAENLATTNMTPMDLLKMDVSRILKGQKRAEDGSAYNEKITKKLQRAVKGLRDAGNYTTQVILLGNTKNLTTAKLDKLLEGYTADQYPHERIFQELLFPVINGTYFTEPNLSIEIKLVNSIGQVCLDYNVKADASKANIKLVFVPNKEIGRIMSVYKNSILKFNPRSFLELKNNTVNRDIENSITQVKSNEFSIFNNGVTIISDHTSISSDTAKKGAAQLVIRNPQLVNGGQTAYTLSRIYDDCDRAKNFSVFTGKEVLLRVITFSGPARDSIDGPRLKLIGDISRASNSQTKIEESDRRSNDEIQLKLQQLFFEKHGLYYERKLGEFSDGLLAGYITEAQLVNRDKIIRIALASNYRVNQARSSISKFFDTDVKLGAILVAKDVDKYAYGYEVTRLLDEKQKNPPASAADRYHTKEYGQALRYGKHPVVAVCINKGLENSKSCLEAVDSVLSQWIDFETWAAKKPSNSSYIPLAGGYDYVNYYKGATINSDIQEYPFLV